MIVYTLIKQKPLNIKTYTSLVALIEDNNLDEIGASRSKLEKYDFNRFSFINSKFIISKSEPQTAGDVSRKKSTQS